MRDRQRTTGSPSLTTLASTRHKTRLARTTNTAVTRTGPWRASGRGPPSAVGCERLGSNTSLTTAQLGAASLRLLIRRQRGPPPHYRRVGGSRDGRVMWRMWTPRPNRGRRASLQRGLAASEIALALVAPAPRAAAAERPPVRLVGYRAATRASGHPVLCGTSDSTWRSLARTLGARDALGFWSPPFILLAHSVCRSLARWRHADPWSVSQAIFVLGHESGHADQLAAGVPYDEADADCRALGKWRTLKHRLAIARRLPSPTTFPRKACPLRRARRAPGLSPRAAGSVSGFAP